MASTYIDINGSTSRLASMTRGAIDQARDMQENTNKIIKLMTAARDDVADADASFVTLGGLLGVTPAKARTIYVLFLSFQVVINKAGYDALVDNLG